MKKNKTIKEQLNEQKEDIENFKKQLKLAGVKDKTIQKMLLEIQEHQEEEYKKQMIEAFDRMRKIILGELD